jgi:hypothetical protein
MKINAKHTDLVRAALREAQGGASARILTAGDVAAAAADADGRLLGAHDRALRGARVTYCRHVYARGWRYYRQAYVSTCIVLERGTSSWFLIAIERVQARTVRGSANIDLTIEAPRAAVDQVLRAWQARQRIFPQP